MNEKDIERALVRMTHRHGGYCLKWVSPCNAGVPDRILLLPGGRIYFVEVKRPKGGRLSPLQKWWGRRLKEMGFQHWVVWNKEDIERLEGML